MNIRAKIYGGGDSNAPDNPLVERKAPRGAKSQALDSVSVQRGEIRSKDGRFEDRHRLIDEAVVLRSRKKLHEVQLVNVSGGGAMVAGDVDIKLWDKVELNFGEDGTVECAVRWVRGDRFGLEFAHETRIDCGSDEQAAVLREVIRRSFPDVEFEADTASSDEHAGPEGRSDRRHPLVWSGLLHHDYESTPVRLRNISETGAMIECPAYLTVGSEPLLELGEGLSLATKVSWMVGDQAGLRFQSKFDLYDLARSRPEVAASHWEPPSYLATDADSNSPWSDHWKRSSLGQLRQDLEGFLKR